MASVLARVAQSLFVTPYGQEVSLQVYVDDPILAIKGTKSRRRVLTARFLACFVLLGVRLAFPKAQCSNSVTWIGLDIVVLDWSVTVTVPRSKLEAVLEIIDEMERSNVISLKSLRTLAGKPCNIATVIYM